MKTILVPVDFSTATTRVLDATVELAKATDSEVVLINAVMPPTFTGDYGLAVENVQELIAVSEKAAARQLDHLKQRVSNLGVQVRTLQVTGPAVSSIIEAAQKHAPDYIVMGSHGHTALYDLLVGSTTHGVLKDSPCPVVIVPPEKS